MRRTAFTLVELLVVIAIIVLLVAMLLPSLQQAKEITRRMICTANLHGIGAACHVYANNWGVFPNYLPPGSPGSGPTSARDPRDGGWIWQTWVLAWWEGRPANGAYSDESSIPYNFRSIIEGGYFDQPQAFYCPSQREGRYAWPVHERWWTGDKNWNTVNATTDRIHSTYGYLPYYGDEIPFLGKKGAARYNVGNFDSTHLMAIETVHLAGAPQVNRLSHPEIAGWSLLFCDASARMVRSKTALSAIQADSNLGTNKWAFKAVRDDLAASN